MVRWYYKYTTIVAELAYKNKKETVVLNINFEIISLIHFLDFWHTWRCLCTSETW